MPFAMATLELTPFPSPANICTSPYISIPFYVRIDDANANLIHHATYSLNELPKRKLKWKSRGNNRSAVSREGLLKNADTNTYAPLLQACTNVRQLKQLHAHMFTSGFDQHRFILSKLVGMYAVCGRMEDARLLFDKICKRNLFLWNAMIRGYATNGPWEEALACYYQMRQAGIQPNNFTFPFALKACASLSALEEGEEIHDHIIRTGFESDVFVGNALVAMYAKCGSASLARQLFDKMSERDVVSWNAMIAGYVENGWDDEALTLFDQMQLSGAIPDSMTVVSVVQACTHLGDLQQGKWIHDYIIRRGFDSDLFVGNSLIDMHSKCGSVEVARQLFDKMSKKNVVSWSAMIDGYVHIGDANEALLLFQQMQLADVKPNSFTVASVIQACGQVGSLQQGKWIHDYIIQTEYESDVFVRNSLIDMYAECGSVEAARCLFDKMSERNVVSWSSMIAGYVRSGHANEALRLFHQMQLAVETPNSVTIVSVLQACAHLGVLQHGMWIHCYIIKNGFELDVFVGNSLIDMYAKCGKLEIAHRLFEKMSERNVISWSAMIAGYAQSGNCNEALALFHKMKSADVIPNAGTVVSVLQACSHLASLQQGKCVHSFLIITGLESDDFVRNALIHMYAKCGKVEIARQLFDKLARRDVISWNSMIVAYAQNGLADEALTIFNQMQLADMKPDSVTLASVLQACAHFAALQQGKWVHCYIIRNGLESNVVVGNSLIDMYAKCGQIELARHLFDKMCKRNVVSWNAMIVGYGMHGHGKDALELFYQMQQSGLKPNHITFVGVLSACSHAGLVEEGRQQFDSMIQDYFITPTVEHYACMVDLLGRAGYLNEAHNFIKEIPFEAGASVWGALLGACRIHCNIELGEQVAEQLFELEPENPGYYVLLSNIYAAAGRWDDVSKLRTMMKNRGLRKTPGCSLIEVNNKVHAFLVGDRSHPQSEKIYAMLETLAGQIKEAGYVPNTDFVLHDVEEVMKEHMISSHSEKLAIAFGLINTNPGIPIRITKNLRVCDDCHSVTKFISRIVKREIVVRDANRFHHFRDGSCSCGDYW